MALEQGRQTSNDETSQVRGVKAVEAEPRTGSCQRSGKRSTRVSQLTTRSPKAADLKSTPMVNVGARLVETVANKTMNQAGDAATTTYVLARPIFLESCKAADAGMNTIKIKPLYG